MSTLFLLTMPARHLMDEMVGAFAAMLFFYGFAWLLLRTDFARSLHRNLWRQEPSSADLKIARSVGYFGIFFGSIMLLAVLIDLFRLILYGPQTWR